MDIAKFLRTVFYSIPPAAASALRSRREFIGREKLYFWKNHNSAKQNQKSPHKYV